MRPPFRAIADLEALPVADLLMRTGGCARERGLADWIGRFVPTYAEAAEAGAIRTWILDVGHGPELDARIRYKLEMTLGAISLEGAEGRGAGAYGGIAHPLLLSLCTIAGMLDGLGLPWESTGWQDLHCYGPEVLAALARHVGEQGPEEAALAACILLKAAARLEYAEVEATLLAYILRLCEVDPGIREVLRTERGPAATIAAELRARCRGLGGDGGG